jgi:protein-S-isoprenylcysteine O-methyltransferase Ste14
MIYWISIPIVFLISLAVFRGFVRRDYSRQGTLSSFSTFLEFLIFGIHANLPYLYLSTPWPGLPPAPGNTFQLVLGLVVIVLGLLATLTIMSNLGFKTTLGNQPDQLRQSGPYRWSRNPQLLTYGFLLLGCVILYPSWQAGAWLVLYSAITHVMVLTEEEHLGAIFKGEYQIYCRQVPRYVRLSGSRKKPADVKD